MSATIDIRKSALTLLGAAVLSLAGGLASSVHGSPLAASARFAVQVSVDQATDSSTAEGSREQHRLARPANRFHGFVGSADQRPAHIQGR